MDMCHYLFTDVEVTWYMNRDMLYVFLLIITFDFERNEGGECSSILINLDFFIELVY